MDLPPESLLLLGAHSAATLLVHVVWATHRRAPWLDPSLDRRLADLLEIAARRVNCTLLAAGNAADHVHVLVRHPPSVAIATLVQRLKGTSAHSLSVSLAHEAGHVWQVGYWAQTVGPSEFRAVATYVANQRAHHDEPHAAPEPWETAPSLPAGRASMGTGCDEPHPRAPGFSPGER